MKKEEKILYKYIADYYKEISDLVIPKELNKEIFNSLKNNYSCEKLWMARIFVRRMLEDKIRIIK